MNKLDYEQIKYQIEHTWPKWKIEWANRYIHTSPHAQKLQYKGDRDMKIGGFIKNDFSAAPGVCVTVFMQGCPIRCPGCHNPELQDFNGGRILTDKDWKSIIEAIDANGIKRDFCVMGGEPLCKENIFDTASLILGIRARFPDIKIYVWTGYTIEELYEVSKDDITYTTYLSKALREIDYLIDGPFKQEERDITLCMRGSRNQHITDVKTGKDVTDDFENRARQIV